MQVISTVPSVCKKYHLEDTIKKEKCYQNILLAYQGLLWYKLWIKSIDSHSLTSQVSLGISLEHVASSHLEKMTECFLSFYQDADASSKVWDVIIVPHVRTLEHRQKFDEAKELLQKYRSLNPQNPNAQRYYYYFLCRRNSGIEEQMDGLKALAAHVPSDPLVLTLCEHLQIKDEFQSCVMYLFDLLDYDCWKKKIEPWKKLVDILEKLPSVNTLSKILNPLWSQRKTWWPQYHFLPMSVPQCVNDSGEKDLYITKMILTLFLRDPQLDSYIKTVERLTNDEDETKITSVKIFISKSD